MSPTKISGVVIILGSILFLVAAFLPISAVYVRNGADAKLALINGAPRAWLTSQILFALGAWTVAAGVLYAAIYLPSGPSVLWVRAAATLLIIGAVAWTLTLYQRIQDPAIFAAGAIPGWQFALYNILTIAALLMLGVALLSLGFGKWAGWLLIGGSLGILVLYLVFGDIPPFVHYFLAIAFGISLYRNG